MTATNPKPPTVSAIRTSTNYGLNEADKLLQIAGSVGLLLHYLVSLDRCIFSSSYGGQPHKRTYKIKIKRRTAQPGLTTTALLRMISRLCYNTPESELWL